MSGARPILRTLAFFVCARLLDRRFAWHYRRHQRHAQGIARHLDGMTALLARRAALCARHGGRPGPPAPRSGSGVPILPLPPHQAAGSSTGTAAAVPSSEGAAPRPGGAEDRPVATRGDPHPR